MFRRQTALLRYLPVALAAACLAACTTGRTPTLTVSTPEAAGMSPAVLDSAVAQVRRAVEEDRVRGAVLLIARRGRVVVHEAFGYRDREAGLRMEEDSLFRMASNTKPVIASAILMLAEQGQVDLSAPVGDYLPAFREGASAGIRVEHLLSHTGGLRIEPIFLSPLLEPTPEHPDRPNLRDEAARFGAIGPEVEPGTSYSYSNPGYNTLGAVVETVSGMPLATFLRDSIYLPLGMTESLNHESEADHGRMSKVYRRTRDGGWRTSWEPGQEPDYPFVRASGGMISTPWDYAVFLQTWLNGGTYGSVRLLRPSSVSLATMPYTRRVYTAEELEERTSFYGFGWNVSADGVYSHGGSDGTLAWVDPSHEVIGLLFTQTPGGFGGTRGLIAQVGRAVR